MAASEPTQKEAHNVYIQDVLRYVGFGFLALSVVLAVLSLVVFVTRDVRGALRFLRGGSTSQSGDASTEHRSLAMHKSHVVTRSTRDGLAMAESGAPASGRSISQERFANSDIKDSGQDAMATVVGDTTQDGLATVISSDVEDDVPTIVDDVQDDAVQVGLYMAGLQSYERGAIEHSEPGFTVVQEIVITNAEVDLDVI